MINRLRGSLSLAMLASASAIAIVAAAPAYAQEQTRAFDIPEQPLSSALMAYSRATDMPVVARMELLDGKQAPAVRGSLTDRAALQRLLEGSGLRAMPGASGGIVLEGVDQGPQGGSAGAEADNAVEALIVTAQKKEEAIQDVPIAISAFTQKSLDAQKIEGGFDLLKAIPNVTFSKNNFSGYNFSIRGIGTKAISAATDPGVAVAFNNTTLIVNRLFEQEYFDVERVEVLRGPQGTLYGRNATSGVINVLSARPRLGEFEGDVELEVGNYNAQRIRAMINVPVGDTLAVRAAYAATKREGYGFNEANGEDVDDRDLWSSRITVGWEPAEGVRANLLWEHFEEDDQRVRTSKQLCHHDAGPQTIGSFDWSSPTVIARMSPTDRAGTSQGCLPGSLYDDAAFGTPNGASLPFILALYTSSNFGGSGLGGNPFFNSPDAPCPAAARDVELYPLNMCQPDPYGGQMQNRDLRTISSLLDPAYRANADIYELTVDVDIGDYLTFTSQSVYSKDEYYATQDYNRFATLPMFANSSTSCDIGRVAPAFGVIRPICETPTGPFIITTPNDPFLDITPGGVYTDPQLGASDSIIGQDLSEVESEQWNQEFRLASNFDSDYNFSLGANFTRFKTLNDYYVFINALTYISEFFPFNNYGGICETQDRLCVYVDPNPLESINGEGHNYFRSANPYELTSSALFGEFYWQATDTLKVTAGARMTWDRKVFTPIPSQLLLFDYRDVVPEGEGPDECVGFGCPLTGTGVGGRGSPPLPNIVQEWREPTGRLIVDWKPDLSFTDETMIYTSLSHGYKGGGANPPGIAPPAGTINAEASGIVAPPTFEPEYIDALEIGTKNTLLDGALVLNGSAFYYDYEGYQVSKIVDRSAANENFDATVWGLELEWIFSPTRNLRFNGALGYLQTEISEGERSIDLMDRAQGGHHESWIDADGVEHALAYHDWIVLKPSMTATSNCIAPRDIVEDLITPDTQNYETDTGAFCPSGNILGAAVWDFGFTDYDPATDAPNGGAGFFQELGGNDLPNAPHYTASLGARYRMALPGGWDATLRGDFYWQSQSYARVYNTQYDKLRAWTNTNISFWVENPDLGVTAEVYVKNIFDETPITDAFLNSDDSGLTTNVFTLDPRLVGVSVRKSF